MDIIKLLPDSVANQIAAGEVILRPASAAKELLENAIDAGASQIILIVKDSGKTLIQVTDNGSGMSETDARLCFERHATSKIREASDLFAIRTMGFRGEALASIAAIAQVELKTKRVDEETGICIAIEGSSVKSQQPCQCADGTSIAVKNLFYNVPARRNFLKSDTTEMNYIIEEFQRVALVNPEIAFSLFHNGKPVFQIEAGNLKQRIISIFGDNYSQRLVTIELNSNIVNISGYIGKPEFAKRTRGEQYFFANGRFIKHPYLHHAVEKAFEELLPEKTFPSYFIFLEVDPKTIDINIHPTKTEVKFEDEKNIYMILRSAVKQSLGKYSLTPSLDFDIERSLDFPDPPANQIPKIPEIKIDPNFNPFKKSEKEGTFKQGSSADVRKGLDHWEKLYDLKDINLRQETTPKEENDVKIFRSSLDNEPAERDMAGFYQLHNQYIITQIKSGLMVIHQQFAHERILYEQLLNSMENEPTSIQQQLFPQTLTFSPSDSDLLRSLHDDLYLAGFEIEEFGPNTFIVNGIPSGLTENDLQGLVEQVLENYKRNSQGIEGNPRMRLAASLARRLAIRAGKVLSGEEMRSLVDQLFACKMPDASPSGKRTFTVVTQDDLERRFK